ncbi:MAG: hypothetical protein AMXMBFR26_06900 [Porticoccaceae bacterium]
MAGKSGASRGAVRQYQQGEVTVTGVESILHNPVSFGLGDVVTVRPLDGTVYLGASGVTAATGFPVNSGESFELKRSDSPIWAITAGGAVKVRKLVEIGY